jgi:hypothetical protein
MSDSISVRAILEAAEQAAAAGDLEAAGERLRQAVQLQEAELGRQHPDLANTLNNLGVVCEKTGRLDEAAACYQRAYDIAVASFEPGHPFVITSRKNLEEFREAHRTAVEPPPAATVPVAAATGAAASPADTQRAFPVARLSAVIIGVIAVLLLGVSVMRRSNATPAASPAPPAPAASTPSESGTVKDAATPSVTAPPNEPGNLSREVPPPTSRGERAGSSAKPARGSPARAAAQVAVAAAQVCRRFSPAGSPDWRCERAGSSVAPGSLVYYTRIKAPTATEVEHRWYHGDELQQRVVLDVAANPTAGYRTYSRMAVSAPGAWRVELRTTSGALLHQERFTVR